MKHLREKNVGFKEQSTKWLKNINYHIFNFTKNYKRNEYIFTSNRKANLSLTKKDYLPPMF